MRRRALAQPASLLAARLIPVRGAVARSVPSLGRGSVLPEKATRALLASDLGSQRGCPLSRLDDLVTQPLVRPFTVVVQHELNDGPEQHRLPEDDHSGETLFLGGSDEALGEGVAVRCPVVRFAAEFDTLRVSSRTNPAYS